MKRGRQESLRRVLTLFRQLEGLRYAPPLAVLAKEFQVTERTVRRDLELLESVGLKVPMWRLNEQLAEVQASRRVEPFSLMGRASGVQRRAR